MSPLDVFEDPQANAASQEHAMRLLKTLAGAPVVFGLAALFSTFVAICIQQDMHAGAEFEKMLAALEDRAEATHRNTGSVH